MGDTVTVDFRQRMSVTIVQHQRWENLLQAQADRSETIRKRLQKLREKFSQPTITRSLWGSGECWTVYIPPFHASHFDGDNILGPFGDTEWQTLTEAVDFLDRVLTDIAAGKYDTWRKTDE